MGFLFWINLKILSYVYVPVVCNSAKFQIDWTSFSKGNKSGFMLSFGFEKFIYGLNILVGYDLRISH